MNVVMLGGMSECGKSHGSKFLAKNGFHHQKIVFFEDRVAAKLGHVWSADNLNPIAEIYKGDHQEIFKLVEKEMLAYCAERGVDNLVMDSTTRKDMVEYFKRGPHNYLSIFIDTDLEKRIEREHLKLGGLKTLDEVRASVAEKDKTKLARGADKVREVSVVVTNNGTAADFEAKLLEAVRPVLSK